MDGRKILGVLRLRARQLKSVEYPGGAALRMTEIKYFVLNINSWCCEAISETPH
jgi:hypothetical protein